MHEVNVKHILSSENGMNIYRGCTHGCIYCDARSRCYQIDHEFEDIEVKANAVELLEQSLRSKRKKCMIGTGGMSDPYIHLEEKLCHTRQCLELIERYGFGVTVHTKSTRIMRDMDLLERINRQSKCVVQVTMTTGDEELCRLIEPNVSTAKERFEILTECKRRGIPTVVWVSPLLPFINDTEENIRSIMDYCVRGGVYGIICFGIGLTLREGNREYFYRKLDEHFPGIKERYIRTYGNAYEIGSQNNGYLMGLIREISKRNNIICDNDEVFSYLHTYEERGYEQLSLFSLLP